MGKWKKNELMEKQKISDILSHMDHVQSFSKRHWWVFKKEDTNVFWSLSPAICPKGFSEKPEGRPFPPQLSLCPGLGKWAFCHADKARLTPTPQEKGGFLDFCSCNPEGQINKA